MRRIVGLKSATNGVGGPLTLLPRQIEWECRQAQAPGRNQPAEISVLQFNVLADGLCGRSPTLGGFTRPPREILEWAYRGPLLVEVRLPYTIGWSLGLHTMGWSLVLLYFSSLEAH